MTLLSTTVRLLAAICWLALAVPVVEAQEHRLPVRLAARIGSLPTPDFASDCGHSHFTVGYGIKSRGSWFGAAGVDHLISLGGRDILCLGSTEPSSGTIETSEGLSVGGTTLLRAGLGHTRSVGFITLQAELGGGVLKAETAAASAHPWAGVELRGFIFSDHLAVSYLWGTVRYPRHIVTYRESGEQVGQRHDRRWGRFSSLGLSVLL